MTLKTAFLELDEQDLAWAARKALEERKSLSAFIGQVLRERRRVEAVAAKIDSLEALRDELLEARASGARLR